ncbi:hypothetical protein [Nocardia sp. NBC_00511]
MQALYAIVTAGTAMAALGYLTFGFMAADVPTPTDDSEATA